MSFGRGPDKKMIARFQQAGIKCVPTVGAVKHAQKMAELGVDMLVVQGGEGGGHTGSVARHRVAAASDGCSESAGGGRWWFLPTVAAWLQRLRMARQGIAMGTRLLMTSDMSGARHKRAPAMGAATVDDIFVTSQARWHSTAHDPQSTTARLENARSDAHALDRHCQRAGD